MQVPANLNTNLQHMGAPLSHFERDLRAGNAELFITCLHSTRETCHFAWVSVALGIGFRSLYHFFFMFTLSDFIEFVTAFCILGIVEGLSSICLLVCMFIYLSKCMCELVCTCAIGCVYITISECICVSCIYDHTRMYVYACT